MSIPKTFEDDPYLSARDIKKILNVGRTTAFKLMHEMKYVKFGRTIRVRQSDFEEWLKDKSNGSSESKR